MNRIKTVIIDDGVDETPYRLGNIWPDIEVTQKLDICKRNSNCPQKHGHGTICAAIIKKYAPDVIIGSIKVLNDSKRCSSGQLAAALKWCADNKINLVNISLGSIDFRDYESINEAVDYAVQKGVIIIAACDNRNIYTYPASLPDVIGVKCDNTGSLGEGEYRYNYNTLDNIDITSYSAHCLKKFDGSEYITPQANSFASPMITAIVYNMLKNNAAMKFEKLKNRLIDGSVCRSYVNLKKDNSCLKKMTPDVPLIAVYDFNGNALENTVKEVKDIFLKNGYNAIAVSGTISDTDLKLEHILYTEDRDLRDYKNVTIWDIIGIYNPDIILLYLRVSGIMLNNLRRMEYKHEIDIRILNIDGQESIYSKFINSGENSKTILITGNIYDKTADKLISMADKNISKSLYSGIIELYKQSNKLVM